MHKRVMVPQVSRVHRMRHRGVFKTLVFVFVLIWIVVNWPHQSVLFVEHVADSVHVFFAGLGSGGRS